VTLPGPRDEVVLDVVRQIPAGSLASYGDVAQVVSHLDQPCTARQVARALAAFGSGVPWWRVVQASGTVAPDVLPEARTRLVNEGVVVNGRRVPLSALRWQPDVTALRRRLVDGG
jgi:alkylated DNA nucleotide flippase Atl1